jgi:hypothetical protein
VSRLVKKLKGSDRSGAGNVFLYPEQVAGPPDGVQPNPDMAPSQLPAQPPVGVSAGWGDMSWTAARRLRNR